MSWIEPTRDEDGRLSTQAMIFQVSSSIAARSRIPRILYHLGIPKVDRVEEAYNTFESLMYEKIKTREAELVQLRGMPGASDDDVADAIGDVFGRLVNARLTDGKLSMSDREIIGNCFIFVSMPAQCLLYLYLPDMIGICWTRYR